MIVSYVCKPLNASIEQRTCDQRREARMKSCDECPGLGNADSITMTWSDPDDVRVLLEMSKISQTDDRTAEDDIAALACLILTNELARRKK